NSNRIINGGARVGLFVDGARNVNPSDRAPQIVDNLFANSDVGINMGSRSFDSGLIALNTFTNNNFDGLQGDPKDSLTIPNLFVYKKGWGLALTSFGNTTAGRGATNDAVTCNTFLRNGIGGPATGNGGILYSAAQFAGNNGSHHANYNNFVNNSTGAVYTAAE